MVKIKIKNLFSEKKEIYANEGESLLEVLQRNGIFIPALCGGNKRCGKCLIKIIEGKTSFQDTEEKRVLSNYSDDFRLACNIFLKEDLTIEIPQNFIISEKSFQEKDSSLTEKREYGFAVDLGTTTVSIRLVNLSSGRILSGINSLNPQISFGQDIVSRISKAYKNKEGLKRLQSVILSLLNNSFLMLMNRENITQKELKKIAIAGNTVMTYLLLGKEVDSLAVYPFDCKEKIFQILNSKEIGFSESFDASVYIFPIIGSFVGGDISAGFYATDILKNKKENILFIDIGTNGEIAIITPEKSFASSTAAGPAFEGVNISCGSLAIPGAIMSCKWNGESFDIETIDKVMPPSGICGTGIFEFISEALKAKLIETNGEMKEKEIRIKENITFSIQDVREFQLGLAALKTGISLLLKKLKISFKELDRVIISGSFGSNLKIESLITTGLLPAFCKEKIIYAGNTSLQGAIKSLIKENSKNEIEDLIKDVKHFPLSTDENFQEIFIEAINFKSPE